LVAFVLTPRMRIGGQTFHGLDNLPSAAVRRARPRSIISLQPTREGAVNFVTLVSPVRQA
jgi:hypothetical protein